MNNGKIIINVNPYKTEGSYYLIIEICKEVGCSYDAGTWVTPVYILPENDEQLTKSVELLDLFEMTYNVVDTRPARQTVNGRLMSTKL